jgi:hypothetical protein
VETSGLDAYHREIPLLYFTDRFFEKKPLCQLDSKVVVERILEGVRFKKLAKRKIRSVSELRSIYAWYHLLSAPEVQDYIQQLPDDKKTDYQSKVELLLDLAKGEGCDRDSLLLLYTQKLEQESRCDFEFFRNHLSLFKGGTIDGFSSEENKFMISFTSHPLSVAELDEFFDDDFDFEELECDLRFLKVEDLQFDEEDDDLEMTISDLSIDEDNQMTIRYFVEEDPNPHLLKVKAKKILCEVL